MKKCLKHIVQLPSLKFLSLGGESIREDTSGLDQLSQLPHLEKLNLKGIFNNVDNSSDYFFPSLYFLQSLRSLRTLNLSLNDCVFYINPIVNLPNLTDLDLSGCVCIRDLREISKLKSLINLNLDFMSDVPTIKKDLESLKELKNLRSLTISPLMIDVPELPKEIIIHKRTVLKSFSDV
jgi:hypothetical protein